MEGPLLDPQRKAWKVKMEKKKLTHNAPQTSAKSRGSMDGQLSATAYIHPSFLQGWTIRRLNNQTKLWTMSGFLDSSASFFFF